MLHSSAEFTKLSCLQYTRLYAKPKLQMAKHEYIRFVLSAVEQSHFHCQSLRLYTHENTF